MTANGWIQIAIFVAILIALARPLGGYMTAVFEGRVTFLRPVERAFHAAELRDQVDRAFIANTRRAGNVVHGIAFQG